MEKLAVIVGMGGGIGYALALKFGREGYQIGMISRNETTLETYQDMLANDGIISHYSTADAGVQKQLTRALDALKEKVGDPEVLIYNAALMKDKLILRESINSIARDIKVNVEGALHSVKQVIRAMKKQNKGTILFTGGGLANEPHPNYGSLSIGKAGLLNLSRQLTKELNYTQIKVGTVIVNGFVKAKDLKYNPTSIAEQFWSIHHQTGKEISEINY